MWGPCVAVFGFNVPCFSPLQGWLSRSVNPSGKRSVVFRKALGFSDKPLNVPCGRCIGCRLESSRQWAMRCVHEASLYRDNCFVTLTYAPAFLPPNGSLDLRHVQLFMKRLRKEISPSKVRFFLCGEYGSQSGRPHYHALLFGFDFPDKALLRTTSRGDRCWSSPLLDSLWGMGRTELGSVSFESAAYVARYICKKVTGPSQELRYGSEVDSNGEVRLLLRPEFVVMSRRPGIGRPWLDRFKSDVFPSDFVVLRGAKMAPPKYYSTLFGLEDPELLARLKRKRLAGYKASDNTLARLVVKEAVAASKLSTFLDRGLE